MLLTMIPSAHDLIVEYRALANAPTKVWCVVQGEEILSSNAALDVAREVARQIALDEQCAAWLVAAGTRIAIPQLH